MKISGIILSGGKSRRMGMDKGLLEIDGKPMILHVIDHLKPLCDQVLISANMQEYSKFGYPVVKDKIKDIGPAGGIISALPLARHKKCIIISCDLPYTSTSLLEQLLGISKDHDITIPRTGTFLQPLCGIYSTDIYQRFYDLVEEGQYAMNKLINQFSLNIVEQDQLKNIDLQEELRNINSLSDLTPPNR